MSARMRASSPAGVNLYARYLYALLPRHDYGLANPTSLIYLTPVQVPFRLTIDRLCTVIGTVAAGNVRFAIYVDNGDLPDGGALLAETASTPAIVRKFEVALPALLQLNPGLYWFASQNDNAANEAHGHERDMGRAGTLNVRIVVQAYGAFPNPCPVTAASPDVRDNPWMFARVASVP